MNYGQALEKYIRDKGLDPYSLSEEEITNEAKQFREANQGGNILSRIWSGLTGETSANATLEANKMNIENQNYWNQMTMTREDTAHQREMADLQAAGLNPWLSVGGGASTASMSTAQAEPVDGSKMLQATSAMALLAITKVITGIMSRERTIYRK